MRTDIKRRLNKFARVSKAVAFTTIRAFADAVELVMIDLTHGKGKYRKRGPRMRPIIHRTYNRTVYIRRETLPIEQVQAMKGRR